MSMIKTTPIIVILKALTAADENSKEIQLLPYGNVETNKGDFLVDEHAINEIMNSFSQKANETVVDYEHQTLSDIVAPAAGWIKELVNKGKDGLWAKVEWTPKAAEYIRNKEYKYLSPVILVRKSDKRPISLHSAGITNKPAIDGMFPLAAKDTLNNLEGKDEMEEFLKQLAQKLGLPETATKEEIQAAIDKAVAEQTKPEGSMVAHKEALTLLGLPENASLLDLKAKVIAIQNPTGYVKAEEFLALKEKLELRDRNEIVELALSTGKITPAQKEWAEGYASKDHEGFKAFVANAPVVVPLTEIAKEKKEKSVDKPDDVQLSVNSMLGISDDDYKKYYGGKE